MSSPEIKKRKSSMFNSKAPDPSDLPTSAQLIRSTLIALAAAVAILVTVVLPSEYGIDPTGVGGALGLAEMGEIKTQLAEEAEADRRMQAAPEPSSSLAQAVFAFVFGGPAAAQEATRSDVTTFTLAPGEGAEWKLTMAKGAVVRFAWTVEGGVVNYDQHGDGGGENVSYEKGRAVPGQEGALEAAFDGKHGWFWRNRGKAPVTVILRTEGAYAGIERLV
jgi:hypothetical protein